MLDDESSTKGASVPDQARKRRFSARYPNGCPLTNLFDTTGLDVMTTSAGHAGKWFDVNVARAGELFLKSLWIQGQMTDLLIFAEMPELVEPFEATPAVMPDDFVRQRLLRWESLDFGPTKDAFLETYDAWLDTQDQDDLEFLSALRNAIGHAHVSMGRDYFLYRPRTRREGEVIRGLSLPARDGAMDPRVVKLAFFNDEYYLECLNCIRRLDERCLEAISQSVGVQHSRIR